MSMRYQPTTASSKHQTGSFNRQTPKRVHHSQKYGHTPDKEYKEDTINMQIRFGRKDLRDFDPGKYVCGNLTTQDVIDLKEVFDSYDQTGMGILLPNDLKLLLNQNGFNPRKNTTYEIIAQFDAEETGGISFIDFMKAMDTKPYINQTKKEIAAVFKKYDRENKGYIDLEDLNQVNRYNKQNLDHGTLVLMLQKADSNNDNKISFQDFYSVMVKNIY